MFFLFYLLCFAEFIHFERSTKTYEWSTKTYEPSFWLQAADVSSFSVKRQSGGIREDSVPVLFWIPGKGCVYTEGSVQVRVCWLHHGCKPLSKNLGQHRPSVIGLIAINQYRSVARRRRAKAAPLAT